MLAFEDYRSHDATGLAQLVRDGQATAAELLETAIARTEQVNGQVNAVVQQAYDEARRVLSDGVGAGPLTGVPYLLKDLYALYSGQQTSNGSRLWADYVADHDTTYTERCRAAGLVIFGKTNSPELGLNMTTEPLLHGPSRNPWNPAHSTGGSSGGAAAAVAAGILPMAHATDGGGSIRIPAANCGLFGLKPTRGRNPAGPDIGEGWSGMSTGHVVSRSVRDSALALDCTHGPAPGDPYCAPPPVRPFAEEVGAPPGQLRVAMLTAGYDGSELDPACVAAVEDVAGLCEQLGHRVEPAGPVIALDAMLGAMRVIIAGNLWNAIALRSAELGREPSGQDVEPITWAWASEGRQQLAADYALAVTTIHQTGRRLGTFFQDYDVILSTTLRRPPLPLGTPDQTGTDFDAYYATLTGEIPFTPLYNVTGCPAMSVPLAWSDDGLPIGVHFGAAFGREDLLLRLAAQLEAARPWFARTPPL